jgi:FkbM family methyltransferase
MNAFKGLFWKLPKTLILFVLRIRFKGNFEHPTKFKRNKKLILLQETNPNKVKYVNEINFFYPTRISRYFIGINERIELLGREYCIDQIIDMPEGIIIDIGSNIGEFTLLMNSIYPNRSFLRFEPSWSENLAAEVNLKNINQTLIPKPLWSHITEVNFFNSNESGDSSIFQPYESVKSTKMLTTTLDSEIEKIGISRIALIKLEAEGAEPEILQGAIETMRITKYITADLGPERGLGQERTFSQVNQILNQNGYVQIGKNPGGRECYLFKNMNF